MWVEIELVGEDNRPIPDERYEIIMPDGSVRKGRLDPQGWARVDGIDPKDGTTCRVCFPDLDRDAWELIEAMDPKSPPGEP